MRKNFLHKKASLFKEKLFYYNSAMISDPVAVFLVLAAVVYVAIRLEERFTLFRSFGSALVGILLAMALSNLGLLPGNSPTYEFLLGRGVSVGVALILLSVDLRSIWKAGPRMLAAFGIGSVGTAAGAIAGALVLSQAVGPETWKLAGQFTGTYTGGGLNFAAVGRALHTSSDLFTAGIAADVGVTALWMAACLAIPVLFRRSKPAAEPERVVEAAEASTGQVTLERRLHNSVGPIDIADLAALVTIAMAAVWGAEWLSYRFPTIPEVLWLSTLVLMAAQVPAVKLLAGGALLGNYLLLLFLASNGAQSVIANIFRVGPAVFYYAAATVAVHGIVIFGIGRLAGIDVATLAVASQANVGGPASAMALAGARGYTDRLLPGVAVGLMGYAVGNYFGLAVATLVRSIL